jgi:hypothetical protein
VLGEDKRHVVHRAQELLSPEGRVTFKCRIVTLTILNAI